VAAASVCSRWPLSKHTERLPVATLLQYALPAVPIALLTGPAMASLPNFYAADIGMPLAAVGVALTLARLWDALADPVIGMLGDRTKNRFGRRRPWMIAGIPLLLLGAWFALARPDYLNALTLIPASIIMYSGWTMIKLSHDAWGAELSDDYAERVRVTAWREGFGLLGGLLAIGLIGWGLSKNGPGQAAAYDYMYIVLAIALLVFVPLACWQVPVGTQRIPATVRPRDIVQAWQKNPALRKLSAAYLMNTLAAALPATLFQAFVIHALLRSDLQGPLILLYSLSAILAVPAWTWAAKRFGKHQAWGKAMLASALFFAPAVFLREGDAAIFAVICVATGICFAADLVLPPAIQADVLDEDRLLSGQDRAGLLFAWLGFLSKLGYALAPGIAFPLLALVDFSPVVSASNSDGAIAVLAGLYALAPVLLKVAAWRCLTDFPLDQTRQQYVQSTLAREHS
jgi:glycoside/pentoside/hexuronide:cation symporter, GPH family